MQTTYHWSTPIYRSNINDPSLVQSCLEMADDILTEKPVLDEYGTAATMDEMIHIRRDPRARGLYAYIRQHVDVFLQRTPNYLDLDYTIKVQLCVLEPGQVTGYHGHDLSFLTGIVYMSPQNTGLILHDPRVNAARGYPTQFNQEFRDVTIVPEPGDVVLFPSYVYHSTMVHHGSDKRVVYPFNAIELRNWTTYD